MSEATPQKAIETPDYTQRFDQFRVLVERQLEVIAPSIGGSAPRLRQSIRYSLLDGGKRLRPLVAMITAESLGANPERAIAPACAIEMVHTASLIIDDLPSMDNARQRRGKRTNHLVHGEDIAILGAISLISDAFGVINRCASFDAQLKVDLSAALSDAIGVNGLCAGQERDLRELSDSRDAESLRQLQHQKTGALFVLALETGARVAGVNEEDLVSLRKFGTHAGLAFQILDDLLDTLGDAASTGKDHASDNGKNTYAAIMSVDEAEARAQAELDAAIAALGKLNISIAPFAAFLDLVLQSYHLQAGRSATMRVSLSE